MFHLRENNRDKVTTISTPNLFYTVNGSEVFWFRVRTNNGFSPKIWCHIMTERCYSIVNYGEFYIDVIYFIHKNY